MPKKILRFSLIISCLLYLSTLAIPAILPTPSASAVTYEDICSREVDPELLKYFGCEGESTEKVKTVVVDIIRSVILVCGTVAVVFVIIGGVDIMTSSGDPNKIKKGKDTILYAAVGLVICALSFIIVNWVASHIINPNITPESEDVQEEVTLKDSPETSSLTSYTHITHIIEPNKP